MNVSTTGKNFIKSYEKHHLDVYDDLLRIDWTYVRCFR